MKKHLYSTILNLFFLSFLVVAGTNLKAQNKVPISGKITSATDGTPLVGATVAEKDKDNRIISGVMTDINGNYVIKVTNTNNILSFSFIGFKQKTDVPNTRRQIDIILAEDVMEIEQIVVHGTIKKVNTGEFEMDKSRIATAIQTISTKDISDVQASSIVDQLQGRLSGVDIIANSGEPGAGMSIRIRGTSSLNASSQPLIVINGVPFETKIDNTFDFGTADEQGYASLIGVSAEDIEEISVLKDAAATAQYGSRAANGVLLISTKRGARGKAVFNYSYKGTVGYQPDGFPMLNGDQYTTLIREELLAPGGNLGSIPQIEYNPSYIDYNLYNKNTNWLKEITRLGIINEHNFSISGGGEKATYRISSALKKESGTTVGTGSKLFTARAILDYFISDKIRISTELSYSHGSVDRSYGGIRDLALNKMPNMSIWELDNLNQPTGIYYTPVNAFQGAGDKYYNPVAMANLAINRITNNRISPVFRINYKPLNNLTYDLTVSFDANNDKTLGFVPEEAIGATWTNSLSNKASINDAEFYVIRTENKMAWNPKIGENHSLFLGGKFETYEKTSLGYNSTTSNTPSGLLQTPIVESRIEGSGNSLSSSYAANRTLAANFMFNYQYLDRYILSGGVRSEGNSKFGSNFRYGTFPSVAARWIVSKEAFMKPLKFINELSLRGSYGQNGNSPDFNYGSYSVYSSYAYNYIDVRPAYPSNIELVNLKWETVIQQNLGLNLTMFDYKVNADVEFYKKRTRDMLSQNTAIPTTSGFSTLPYLNLGDIDNQGFEISVMTNLIKNADFKLDFNFNLSRNVNMIRRITSAMDVEDGDPLQTGPAGYLKRIQENNPIGSFYGYKYLGVYSSKQDLYATDENGETIYDINGVAKVMRFNNSRNFQSGDAKYEDINHDGNINRLDVVYLGNANPLLYGGFGPMLTYRNFQITAFFNFRYHQKVINLARMNTESMTSYDNQNTSVLRRWRYEGQVTDVPRAYYNSSYNTLGSDRFMEDASFLRMKYLTLKYTAPKEISQKLGFKLLSIYFTGQNFYTMTNYKGSDPETGSSDNWKTLGYDTNKTPKSIQFTLGINASF